MLEDKLRQQPSDAGGISTCISEAVHYAYRSMSSGKYSAPGAEFV